MTIFAALWPHLWLPFTIVNEIFPKAFICALLYTLSTTVHAPFHVDDNSWRALFPDFEHCSVVFKYIFLHIEDRGALPDWSFNYWARCSATHLHQLWMSASSLPSLPPRVLVSTSQGHTAALISAGCNLFTRKSLNGRMVEDVSCWVERQLL